MTDTEIGERCESCLGTGRESIALLDWAVGLLANATSSKVLDEAKSEMWCLQFGAWFAQTQSKLARYRKPNNLGTIQPPPKTER